MRATRENPSRKQRGSALLETPGALIILFIFILFPMLDMLGMALKYGCCYTLNQLQLREAALVAASAAMDRNGTVMKVLPTEWKESGLGAFVDLDRAPATRVRYEDGKLGANGVRDRFVLVSTSFMLKPFLNVAVPNLPAVPGLTAPVGFSFESSRPLENPANANK